MKTYREELWFQTDQRRAYLNITAQVEAVVRKSGVREGLVLVNAMHITASVYINDDEPGLLKDYDEFLERLAPHEADYRHNLTGEDNGDAHIKRQPARIIHDGFYCTRRYAAPTSLAVAFSRPGGRARRSVGQQPVQGCLPSARLHAPVSPGVSAVSSRTLMNNAGSWVARSWWRSRTVNWTSDPGNRFFTASSTAGARNASS